MLWIRLLHPNISTLTLRIIGGVAVLLMVAALVAVELTEDNRRKAILVYLSPFFVVGTLVLVYVVLITQGSIR